MKALEVVDCCSSVARALVAKARSPGFNSPQLLRFFHILSLLLFAFIGKVHLYIHFISTTFDAMIVRVIKFIVRHLTVL